MKQLTEHVYYMDADPNTDQPFVFYVKGKKLSLMVDAGNSPENHHKFLNELSELGLPEPDLAVLTHWHWDHTFGVCAVKCPVISSAETDRILARVTEWKWDEASMKERLRTGEDIPFTYDCMHVQYPDPLEIQVTRPDVTFETAMTIDLGGVICHLQHRDSPHTRDAVMIHIPEDAVLIGGDAHYEDYYDNDSKYDERRLTDFIAYLKETPFNLYLKGHDEPSVSKEALIGFLSDALHNL